VPVGRVETGTIKGGFQHTQLLSDIALAFGFNSLHNQLRSAIAS